MALVVSPISWASTTTQRTKVMAAGTTVTFLLLGYFNRSKRFRYNLGWIARRVYCQWCTVNVLWNQSFLETFISSYLIGIEIRVQIFYNMNIITVLSIYSFSYSSPIVLFSLFQTSLLPRREVRYHVVDSFWMFRYASFLFIYNA